MKTGFINIIILPSTTSRPKQLTLSLLFIKIISWSGMVLLVTLVISFFDYAILKRKNIDLGKLQDLAKTQKVQLQFFADKVNDIEAEMMRLKTLDLKIDELTKNNGKVNLIKTAVPLPDGKGGPEVKSRPIIKREGFIEDMMDKLNKFELEIKAKEATLHELHSYLESKKMRLAAIPSSWPTQGHVSSGFGERDSPFNSGTIETHEGLDIVAPLGAPVTATANGVVVSAGRYPDYGYAVMIDHGYGFTSKYAHLSAISVRSGQAVREGQKIGDIGNTGRSTGPHLHYEVAVNGFKVNPAKYLRKNIAPE